MLRDWKPNDAVKAEVERAFNWSAEFRRQVPGELDWDRVTWVEDMVMGAMRFRYTQPASITLAEGERDINLGLDLDYGDSPSVRHIVRRPAWAIEVILSFEQLYRLQPARTFEDDLAELIDAMVDPTRPR